MIINQLLSAVAIILTFIAFFPYVRSIQHGKTKPHVFSWEIYCSGVYDVYPDGDVQEAHANRVVAI